MQHARADYDDVQHVTTNGTTRRIPSDEPVFLLRGQDGAAAQTVRYWARNSELRGASPEIVQAARDHADKMDAWPVKKVADLPGADIPEASEGVAEHVQPIRQRDVRAAVWQGMCVGLAIMWAGLAMLDAWNSGFMWLALSLVFCAWEVFDFGRSVGKYGFLGVRTNG